MNFTQGDASVRAPAALTHTRRRQCGGGGEKSAWMKLVMAKLAAAEAS